jgi:hypothetical protein
MGQSPLQIWLEVEGCVRCGGKLAIIASIEDSRIAVRVGACRDCE